MYRRTLGSAMMAAAMLLAGVFSIQSAAAQNVTAQLGYADHEAIILNMPDYQDIQQQLQKEAQSKQQELESRMQSFQQKVQKFQKQQSLLSDEKRQQRQQQLAQERQRIMEAQQQQQQELVQKEQELLDPLITKVQNAIDKVAQSQNLDMVLNSRTLLYANNNSAVVTDITDDVARELGLEVPEQGAEPGATFDPETGANTPQGGVNNE